MPLHLDEIREALPSLEGGMYFNTGYAGPLPRSAADVMSKYLEADLTKPRGRPDALDEELQLALDAKRAFASVMEGATTREIALTDSTSHGLGIFFAGMRLGPGDEIVTTDEEHPGLGAVLAAAVRWGCELRVVPFSPTAALADEIEGALTSKTKIVAISHISYVSGSSAPVSEIATRIPEGIPFVLDGAHTVGGIPFNPHTSGAAAVAFPGQKWCLGPEGIGGLWISPEWVDRIAPTTVSFRAMNEWLSPTEWRFEPGAACFDQGTINNAVVAGLIESIRWLRDDVGLDSVFEMTASKTGAARRALAHIDGLDLLCDIEAAGGLAGFRLEGVETGEEYKEVAERLWADGIRIRHIASPPGLRASVAFFNTDAEIERLCDTISRIR